MNKAAVFISYSDDISTSLDCGFTDDILNFKEPISTRFRSCLIEDIEFDMDSIGCFALSYEFGDSCESYFLVITSTGQGGFLRAGGEGSLEKAFALFESLGKALNAVSTIPKVKGAESYTIYKVEYESSRNFILLEAQLRKPLVDKKRAI